ncbi:ATP-dependent Clp protease proteolytic subunit ASCRUDRAFT_37744 [Ascoidea rubescens DSM 1968]|uniref:ATP-dependent Clp protease proteolytic subunit n=1 Tax=Ascoidea rubescens DSM 1968 TaxID=1344418 RepID=A0A1D2VCF0_9ASCO|nr:hypothetical protein ASCRUDRAFT_37744 [Ascoidea rubescens DSM 1968]ODV59358.1 hypothetical protein ASCRUDRAFT_37744 [Ascoidea rubescens DSM 1968]
MNYDVFSKLLSERIIYLTGEIDDEVSMSITAQLLYLESEASNKPIQLYINSVGGSVTAGLGIYDTMNFIKSPISTVCIGQACSMASLLLSGGEKGKRLSLPNSVIMLHQPSGGFKGQATDIKIHAEHILSIRERLVKLYQSNMRKGITIEEVSLLLERDKFLTPEDSIEYGLVDKILVRKTEKEDKEKKEAKEAKDKR